MELTILDTGTLLPCRCGSALAHWQRFSGQGFLTHCPVIACVRHADVGAVVTLAPGAQARRFIVPMCADHHAQRGRTLTVADTIALVSAEVAATCEHRPPDRSGDDAD
jgi:hypothetical protein